jgi:CRISPR/Cas system-associated exonuclease Cas4 (RecB family)
MAAFLDGNALKVERDSLRDEIKRLQATIAVASEWVEALERDRLPLPIPVMSEAAYDASLLGTAQALLADLQTATSTSSSTGLNLRVKNTLSIKAYDPTTKGPL